MSSVTEVVQSAVCPRGAGMGIWAGLVAASERKGHFTAPTTEGIIQRGKLHEQKHAGGRVPGGRVPGVRGLELTLGHGKSLKAALQTGGL